MRVLVIGGTGFIGYNLLKKLKSFGYKLTSISLRNPKKLNHISGVNYIKLNIVRKNEFKKIKNKFDIVVNAGGYGGLDNNFRNIKKIYETQYKGLKNISSFFLDKKIKKFIQIGSSLEYGSLSGVHFEKMLSKSPITTYGKSKLYSTNYLKFLNKVYKFPVVILRLYQVYGPSQKKNRVIPYIIDSLIKKKKIYTTKGNQIRDFCYVEDVTSAIVKCFSAKKIDGEIINIGLGKGYKIKNVLKIIFRSFTKYNVSANVKKIVSSKNQTKKLVPSIKKAKKLLNWSPKVSLKKGIKETIINF